MRLGTILGSKILKKGVQIGPKLKRGPGTQEWKVPVGPNLWPNPVTS